MTRTLKPERVASAVVLQVKVPDPWPRGLENERLRSTTSCGQVTTCVQPVAGSQASLVQGFRSSQSIGTCPRQVPLAESHKSVVQALPSSQSTPAGACPQAPVGRSQ